MRSPSGWQGGALRQLDQGERPRSWHMVTHPRPVYGPMQTQGSCVRGRGSADTNPAPVCGILQGRPWCVQGRQRLGYAPCVSSHDSARSARVCAAALGLRARTRPEPATFHARGSGRGVRHPREPPARKRRTALRPSSRGVTTLAGTLDSPPWLEHAPLGNAFVLGNLR